MNGLKSGTRLLWRLLAAAVCMPSLIAAAKPATQWSFQDLGVLEQGFGVQANGINNRGQIVGTALLGLDARAFLWENGTLRDLGVPPDSGTSTSLLFAINDHGVAVGSAFRKLYTWKDGQWSRLPFNLDFPAPTAINKRESIAGFNFNLQKNASEAFLFRDGVLFILPTLGGFNAEAHGINDKDVVVGKSATRAQHQHAFRWDNGVMTDLGTLGGLVSEAKAINNHGVIVGQADDGTAARAFIFDDAGMRPLSCPIPGTSEATAINDSGAIVGDYALDVRRGPVRGFLCDDGELTLLDAIAPVQASGFTQLSPTGINERGWITGTMRDARSAMHSFVLIPK